MKTELIIKPLEIIQIGVNDRERLLLGDPLHQFPFNPAVAR
ncbi:hypothetical protein [Effusibacillus consociatus]|uniref:Uncharacterized protein n=1 Tax=Effusibacillus consociatus TaxID=1117041 RepID=A0ABV9Q2J6_9BACL